MDIVEPIYVVHGLEEVPNSKKGEIVVCECEKETLYSIKYLEEI